MSITLRGLVVGTAPVNQAAEQLVHWGIGPSPSPCIRLNLHQHLCQAWADKACTIPYRHAAMPVANKLTS